MAPTWRLFSRRFIYVLLISALAAFAVLLVINHFSRVRYAREQQMIRMQLVGEGIMERVATIDKLYQAIELYADREIRPLLEDLRDEYRNQGSLPASLHSYLKADSPLQLYVIDQRSRIILTTYAPDLGLDFAAFEEFDRFLGTVRQDGAYFNPRFSVSVNSLSLRKYSYLASHDGKYIFEASYDLASFKDFLGADSFTDFFSKFGNHEPGLISVRTFAGSGSEFTSNGMSTDIAPEPALTAIKQAFSANTIQIRSSRQGEVTTSAVYYPFVIEDKWLPHGLVIEVVYTDKEIQQKGQRELALSLSILGLIAAILLGVNRYFSVYFVKPLGAVLETVEKVRLNDFSAKVDIKSRNEIGALGSSINGMISHIARLLDENAQAKSSLQLLLNQNQKGFFETVKALAYAIDAKDPYTGGHCERVMLYSQLLGRECGLAPLELETLKYGAILHDIGKIGISDSTLNKSGSFSTNELTEMRRHPEIGHHIIEEVEFLVSAKGIVRSHHERYDGKGYPDKQAGEAIPLLARIVSIADAFDAMTSYREYRERNLSLTEAMAELNREAGKQFDPRLVACFNTIYQTRADQFPKVTH